MVNIRVLLAEVTLDDNDEFGVELGLQDSVLFNRGTAATGSAGLTPGFAFNDAPLGNGDVQAGNVGTQGVTNFGLGRASNTLGVGGMVLSASSEHVSVLLRAIKETHRLEVLSCPSIMTLDNQSAQIQIGQNLSYISGVTLTTFGQTNNVTQVRPV